MESFDLVSKAVARAAKQADIPSPDVAGASDGDGWIWRWEFPRQVTDRYRGDLTLVFKVDAFGELPQLIASARSEKTADAWTQSYPLAHLLLRDIRGHNVDALKFESALGAQLRASWTDLRERAPRLDEIGQRQADALRKLENRGLKIK